MFSWYGQPSSRGGKAAPVLNSIRADKRDLCLAGICICLTFFALSTLHKACSFSALVVGNREVADLNSSKEAVLRGDLNHFVLTNSGTPALLQSSCQTRIVLSEKFAVYETTCHLRRGGDRAGVEFGHWSQNLP